jgi:NitT/TauT family transport system permease protein
VEGSFAHSTGRGETGAPPGRRRAPDWGDLLAVLALAGGLFGLIALARQWTAERRPGLDLDLSPAALPYYALLSLARGVIAYLLTLAFTLGFGYWAARDPVGGRFFYPLVDHAKRAIPVLGLLPLLAVALLAVFPGSNLGLELTAIAVIWAGQFWPMTSGFRHSLRRVPAEWLEMARAYRFTGWQCFRYVELPFALIDLVWNSMMAMARGWFFLMASEALVLGPYDFRLPGLGSYLAEAVDQGRLDAALGALAAMAALIVALDQLLWRPAVAWAERFRPDPEGPSAVASSWFLNRLRQARLLRLAAGLVGRWRSGWPGRPPARANWPSRPGRRLAWLSWAALVGVMIPLGYGGWELVRLLVALPLGEWPELVVAASLTLGRAALALALATLWAVPVGLAVGLSPRLARVLQPVVQVLAAFPAPLLFPLAVAGLWAVGVPLGWGSIVLMLLAAQWYILFNVIGGARAIPGDLREMVRSYRFGRWQRFHILYLPAIFPQLVAGWDAATGAAWNASMVAEAVTFRGQALYTWGLGAEISRATQDRDFARLAACLVVLSLMVGAVNREVWGRCYRLAEQRCAFNR